jgi:hypothetical protein
MRKVLAVVLFLALAGCSAGPDTDPADVAPPDTISRYPSTDPPVPPSAVARENGQTVAAALPTDAEVTGLTRPATPPPTTLKLCPTAPREVPASLVHAAGYWAGGAGQSLAVVAVLDQKTPADQLLATLSPQNCPAKDDKGGQYLYDRQPYESKDGYWTGSLNTSLRTDPTGAKSYEAIYLLSKDDALVNVVASGPVGPTVTFDPAIDETAAHYLQLVLDRFAA